MRVWPGTHYPLGATWDGQGTNFALSAPHATQVELCLFDRADEGDARHTVRLPECTDRVWHGYLPDVRPGQLYGFRVHGPWAPEHGHRFNPLKLVLDPYARALSGPITWGPEVFGYDLPAGDLEPSSLDSAGHMPKCVVLDTAFSWGSDAHPRTPWGRTVIYECHVKGMTALHPQVPEELRGTYLGLAYDPIIEHLLSLGVTAIELLPVHQFVDDQFLVEKGLRNYWGYSTLGFFAPEPRYATGDDGRQVAEFKSMVKAFHAAGIEVILDVVYNHTAEGNHLGPTLSFKGIDNRGYYHRVPEDPRFLMDYTGCGNSLNLANVRTQQMVLDSLRYWVDEMHVDGFRFDLASTLGRDPHEFRRTSRFFTTVHQDPTLARVKLIAEPWDIGPGGYQVGRFPSGWAEWNDSYRDTMRAFWRGGRGQVAQVASRLAGSSDIYAPSGRGPYASVNFITCHDGFTLHDLVSYSHKHNEANGEDNRDGHDHNLSHNWGEEGDDVPARVHRMRQRIKKNLLATLVFSQGVPMLSHGDELGRTQQGNNNAYCQDNELSWMHWDLDKPEREILEFTRDVLRIWREQPVFRRRGFLAGEELASSGVKDVRWLRKDGRDMAPEDWHNPDRHVLGMLLHGGGADEVDDRGRPARGESLLLIVNGGRKAAVFRLPRLRESGVWRVEVDTAREGTRAVRGRGLHVPAHSLLLLAHGNIP